ncbi:MAG TPA: FAD-dependent oxidoreductase, partial [Candidatus Binataceae bacterium]
MQPDGRTGKLARVVILGGGFGGLKAARVLQKAPAQLTLIDSRNHHLFQPLLYQVATAALNPSDIAKPIRSILRKQKNTEVMLGEATSVDLGAKRVKLRMGAVDYDYLVIATGATHSYFGHNDWEEAAPGLKTIEDALEIRRRVLVAFEAAEREPDPAEKMAWMTFVVVGGGPTGVELAGALAEIARRVLERDFRFIDPAQSRIVLVEAGPRLLASMSTESSNNALRQLKNLGTEVITSTPVTAVDDRSVTAGD